MVKYEESIIYKLCCKDTDIKEIYIGSTTNFSRRKSQHKNNCNNENNKKEYNYNVYQFIRDHGGWSNWDMIMIEKVTCNDKRELETKEREFIEKYQATLNKCIPTRTGKEWYQVNRDKVLEQNKIKMTCNCGSIVRIVDKARHERTKKHIKFIEQQQQQIVSV